MGKLAKTLILAAILAVAIIGGHQGLVVAARGTAGDSLATPARATCGACHAR
ncbi:hypothetical protein [Falsiroseomonas stagni]|uniref:Uncharacterized protein n=1 Tax=Falsiroseomonas stagni DSM 19981 TaxID=1123062 RepID=A0A1I4CRE7_9PROT|nr:hypothetical protein [Falsiroseomonas stagni]SFK82521.1 hypothetical protein SAMN02745775_10833 [Falsiroseomonas stagni DSM 19981]